MKEEGIILSEKYGANPSITVCLLCGKDIGIALFGKLKEDVEAPKKCCIGELCDDCKVKLIDNKEIIFCDETGRYINAPEKYLTPEGKKLSKENRIIFVSAQMFNEIINNG